MQNIKKKYPLVLSRINQLVERIKVLGPAASIDVDQAALRVTLDVIGLVSRGLSRPRGVGRSYIALVVLSQCNASSPAPVLGWHAIDQSAWL
jgi:hypothetical protein